MGVSVSHTLVQGGGMAWHGGDQDFGLVADTCCKHHALGGVANPSALMQAGQLQLRSLVKIGEAETQQHMLMSTALVTGTWRGWGGCMH